MGYKDEIIQMITKIDNIKILEYIYAFLNEYIFNQA